MNREEELFKKRLKDLASAADRRGIVVFTDFMNLNELNIFHSCTREFGYVSYQLFGGYEHAERQIAAFLPDALSYSYDFPIISLKIRPLQKKFAEDLSHRDYLGALLNLGVDRPRSETSWWEKKKPFSSVKKGLHLFFSRSSPESAIRRFWWKRRLRMRFR